MLVRESPRSRRLRITVGPREPLRVTVPRRTTRAEIDRMLRLNRDWIAGKVAWSEELSARPGALGLDRPGFAWIGGRPLPILLAGGMRASARLRGAAIVVGGPREHAEGALERWYRREARLCLQAAVGREAARLGLRPRGISVRDPRTRWGSCSSRGSLSFSWRLLVAPPGVLDYVVVHELCHLRELNHSAAFWGLLDRARPGWREQAAWLSEHGLEIGDYVPRPAP
ncbi:MAG TPA: SprT family zinc-dependent metalloprotease [Solirubrobacterales bacterium]|nr:SprT family zinc-dependent metalloprotease [Solirubrobacterales bacterium]